METVSHDGRDTAYRIVQRGGSDPTVLYVHGSGGSHRVWAHQYGPDGPSHPAAALDLSGHGESDDIDTTAGPETLLAYAEDVSAVARAVEADVLVGNSLGGAVIQRILLDGDHEPAAAVLAGTGAALPVAESLRTWLAEDFERAVEWLHGTDRLFHDADEQTRERSVETMYAVGRAVTERDFLSCHTFDVREQLRDVQVPVLALVGEHDTLTPPSYHEVLASELPRGDLTVLDDAAHLAMVDQPAAFNAALADFFDTHAP
ncbi:alpha/beta hydrolase [Salinibaculum salinum]|uniref:alpha/beta fold hydrolase n=1 Tax=Salinibaculum salinum TaxID=3131996 RepID=UPI0030EE6A53